MTELQQIFFYKYSSYQLTPWAHPRSLGRLDARDGRQGCSTQLQSSPMKGGPLWKSCRLQAPALKGHQRAGIRRAIPHSRLFPRKQPFPSSVGGRCISLSVQRYPLPKATPALLPAGRPLGDRAGAWPLELPVGSLKPQLLPICAAPHGLLQLDPGQSFH